MMLESPKISCFFVYINATININNPIKLIMKKGIFKHDGNVKDSKVIGCQKYIKIRLCIMLKITKLNLSKIRYFGINCSIIFLKVKDIYLLYIY